MDGATLVLRSRLKNKAQRNGRDGKMSTVEIENQTVESGGQPVSQRESTIYIERPSWKLPNSAPFRTMSSWLGDFKYHYK